MEPKRTVAFVARRFAHSNVSEQVVEVDSKEEYRAVIVPNLIELKKIGHVDEVVFFLDCGEEMLVDGLPETGLPLWKFHYIVCVRNLKLVMDRVRRVGHVGATFTSTDCGNPDDLPRILNHYLSTGEIQAPEEH